MKKIKEYRGVILFYLLIITCIYLISNHNIIANNTYHNMDISKVGIKK